MIKKSSFLLIIIIFFLSSCQTKILQTPLPEGEAFELFLIADSQMSGGDIQKYELSELPLAEEPLIVTEDIARYNWDAHSFDLTDEAYQKVLSGLSGSIRMSGMPFVIISNGERLYAGAFWSLASSLSYDGVVILQPVDPARSPLFIKLGYPTCDFFTGEDPRSNPLLKQALENVGLLGK